MKLKPAFIFFFFVLFSSLALAAPLDTSIIINPERKSWNIEFSLAIDKVNETLDILNIRAQDEQFAGTTVGDYQGYSGYVDIALWSGFHMNVAAWRRQIDLGREKTHIMTWKFGGQWQFLSQKDSLPSMALRYHYWTNNAGDMKNASSRTLLNVSIDELNITNVKDAQHQVDFIASWSLNPRILFTLFAGLGRSEVGYSDFLVNYNGCQYGFDSPAKDTVILLLAEEVSSACQITRIKRQDPASPFTGPGLGISYTSEYIQLGSSFDWRLGQWRLNAGMRTLRVRRDVDSILSELDKKTYTVNYIGSLTLARKLTKNSAIFVRGQYYYRSWLGEIPLTYNVFTSQRFDRPYGLLSLGLKLNFG